MRSDRKQEDCEKSRAKVKGKETTIEAYRRALQFVAAVPQRIGPLSLETVRESISL